MASEYASPSAPDQRSWLLGDTLIVLALSIAAALFVLLVGRLIWFQDSWTHFGYAYGMVKNTLDPVLSWRGPVYAILLLLCGPLLTGSMAAVFLVQSALAIAAPVLVHRLLAPAGRLVALGAAVVAVATLVPYANMTLVYHDQLIVTGLLAVALITTRIAMARARRWEIYALAVMVLALAWMRPSLLAVAPVAIGALIVGRTGWKDALIAAAACLAVAVVHGQWASQGAKDFSGAARQVFFVVYMSSEGQLSGDAIDAARERLRADLANAKTLRDFAANERDYEALYASYETRRAELAMEVFAHPDTRHFWSLWRHAGLPEGKGWDALMRQMAVEDIAHRPAHALAAAADRFKGFALGPGWRYSAATRTHETPAFWPAYPTASEPTPIKPIAARWLQRGGDVAWLGGYFSTVNGVLQPLAFVLTLVGLAAWIRKPGPERTLALVVSVMLVSCLAAMALLVDPQTRYQTDFSLLAICGAALGVAWLAKAARPMMGTSEASTARLPILVLPRVITARPRLAASVATLAWAGVFWIAIEAMAPG